MLALLPTAWITLSLAAQGVRYDVHQLPRLPDEFWTLSTDLNDAGQVVGGAARDFGSSTWGYVPWKWSLGLGKEELPVPHSHQIAQGIGEYGLVVGGDDFSANQPWSFQDGVFTDLGTVSPYSSGTAYAVNRSGTIAGTLDGDAITPWAAFQWDASGGIVDLFPGRDADARDLNDAGQITGTSYNVAYRYTPGVGLQQLGVPTGMYTSYARGMNSQGDVVGAGRSRSGSSGVAFLYTDGGGMETLPAQNAHDVALDINDRGEVVGEGTGGGTDRAWIWSRADGYHDLNELIEPSLGIYLRRACAINEHGWIAVTGWDSLGELSDFLLVPRSDRGGLVLEASRTDVTAGDRVDFDLYHGLEGGSAQIVLTDPAGTRIEVLRRGSFDSACRYRPRYRVPALPPGTLFHVRGMGRDRLGRPAISPALTFRVR